MIAWQYYSQKGCQQTVVSKDCCRKGTMPMEQLWKSRKTQILLKKIGIAAGVYLGMKYLVPLLVPFLLAALLVYWCWPGLRWAQRHFHLKPSFGMAIILILLSVILASGGAWLGRNAAGFMQQALRELSSPGEAERILYECCDGISEIMHLEAEDVRIFVTDKLNVFRDHASQNILPGAFGSSWEILKKAGSWAAGILVTGVAILLTASDFEKIRLAGRKQPFYGHAVSVLRGILRSAGGYLRAQCIIMGLVILECTAGIWISGAGANPVLEGIGTGILDALPVFGTGTVFVPWILILVFFQKNYTAAVILAVTYGVCVFTRELLEPKLIGGRLGILPVVILASVYAGVKLYGLGGILLGPLSVLLIQELWRQADRADAEELEKTREL